MRTGVFLTDTFALKVSPHKRRDSELNLQLKFFGTRLQDVHVVQQLRTS